MLGKKPHVPVVLEVASFFRFCHFQAISEYQRKTLSFTTFVHLDMSGNFVTGFQISGPCFAHGYPSS